MPKRRRGQMLFKAFIIGLLIALGEVINGNIRVRLLQKIFTLKRAKKVSFFSGITIIYIICWIALPWIDPKDYQDCLFIGTTWFIIMLSLDIYFARYVFKMKWQLIIDDFNPLKGNLLSIGMIFLLLCPALVFLSF